MQTLQILLSLAGIVAYCGLASFACFALARLRRQEQDLRELKMMIAKIWELVMTNHLRSSFEALNDMRATLRELIDNERYEEAEKLKTVITEAEQSAMRELKCFEDIVGRDKVVVTVTSIRRE